MVLIHAGGLSLREAAEEYHRRHPDQPTPHHGSIGRLMERFKTTGSIHDKIRSERPRTATRDASAASVVAKLVVHHGQPGKWRKNMAPVKRPCPGYYPSIISIPIVCTLCRNCMGMTHMRVQFCEWFLERRTDQPNLEADICWSDEACFHLNGTVNTHNAVYWATENPHIAVEAHNKFDPRLNVWCGIHGDVIIGPVFLNNKLTAPLYR
ncbi:hypothetical protein ANN_20386 [Periplaneta americana]|uniref:DUF4817 domain-containing protein n=1 Tax=Periplaneta americana TaxID=6978 RepID=A0ABQ8SDL5_PERAM|nr:hypothetical protein ANN_20386 [Periplaneta americana]